MIPPKPPTPDPTADQRASGVGMAVPFHDLAARHRPLAAAFRRRFDEVVAASAFIGGDYLERFEQEWAEYCGVGHAIGVGNGTDAIELVLRGLGIGPGDEVIVPANTFVATAAAVVASGARPVFVDVDPGTLLLNESAVLAAIGPSTAAVIVVHLYGQMVDVESISSVVQPRGITLIEDAAQAHGATMRGARAGSLGRAATFSFYPGKNLGALGDGGAVITDDATLAERVRVLSNHGRNTIRGLHIEIGRNSRLDGLQAAFLTEKLLALDDDNQRRRELARRYRTRLGDLPITFPEVSAGAEPVFHVMTAQVEERDRFRRLLAERGVETSIHYPLPCHRQPAFERFGPGYLPIVERAARRLVSLPMFPTMADETVDRVCDVIEDALIRPGGGR